MQECLEQLRTAAHKSDQWKACLAAYPVWGAEDSSVAAEYHEIVSSLGAELVELGTVGKRSGQVQDMVTKTPTGGLQHDLQRAADLGCVSGTGGRG